MRPAQAAMPLAMKAALASWRTPVKRMSSRMESALNSGDSLPLARPKTSRMPCACRIWITASAPVIETWVEACLSCMEGFQCPGRGGRVPLGPVRIPAM